MSQAKTVKAKTVTVYVLTGTHAGAPLDASNGERVRTEIGKYFVRADADEHVSKLHGGWIQVRIEERQEHESAQHEAHRLPPAWE